MHTHPRERPTTATQRRIHFVPQDSMADFFQRWPRWRIQKVSLSTIVFLSVALSSATDGFSRCSTSQIKNRMVANCQAQGHKAVPNVNVSTTQVLLLNFNFFSTIQTSSFPRMRALKMLSLGKQLGGPLYVGERAFANVPNITFLDLGGNENLSLHPKAFWGLTQLKVLHLDASSFDNRILEKGYFQDLLSLEVLDLTGNHLDRLRPDPTFQGLKGLKVLQLKLNKIGAICGDDLQYLSGRHLTFLDLSSNKLSSNPSCTNNPFRNITLGTLDISSNPWNVVRVEQFLQSLNGIRIQNLKLQHSGAIGSGFGFQNLKDISATTFSGLRHSRIQTFDMSHGFLSALNTSVFSSLPDLNTLLLRSNQINKIHNGAFSGLNKLQVLDLSDNLLGELYTKGLEDLKSSPLQHLILKSNHIGIVQHGALMGLQSLQFLDLQDNALDRIPSGNLPSLVRLNLGQNRIQDTWGIEKLGPNLVHLDLFSNRLRDLANVWHHLANIPHLKFLNLSSNHLASCSRVEKSPKPLTQLDLSHNDLGNIWATQKCTDLFQHLENLLVLNLSSNHLRDLPGNLFHGLASLEILDLRANMLHKLPEGIFPSLKSLRALIVRGNPLMTLSPSSFRPVRQLQFLDLRELSLVCSCDLKGFQNWLQNQNTIVRPSELTCLQSSSDFQRQPLPQFLRNNCPLASGHIFSACTMVCRKRKLEQNVYNAPSSWDYNSQNSRPAIN